MFLGSSFINIKDLFGGIRVPEDPQQDTDLTSAKLGKNKLEKAQSATFTWSIAEARLESLGIDVETGFYDGFEDNLEEKFEDWSKNTKHVKAYIFTNEGFVQGVLEDFLTDQYLLFAAFFCVAMYSFLFLGSFSPIHCRCSVGCFGLLCVIFAYLSGFGFMFYCGGKTSEISFLMPFLLIAIGIDDVFVICNALDQTNYTDPSFTRIHNALGHAGPAVTITSLTNILAFALGALNALEALSSFCLFASVCIIMLYFSAMTLFMCVLVWDTKRVERKGKECFGACACAETSPICCRGSCLNVKQRRFGGIEDSNEAKAKQKAEYESADLALRTALESGIPERFLAKYVAPCILSSVGRIVVIVSYLILIALSIYGMTQIRIHFEIASFVSDASSAGEYFAAKDKYYEAPPEPVNLYIEFKNEAESDISTEEN